jgi:TruD family tRNA pseudouridine synthase
VDESVVGIQRFLLPEVGGFHGTTKQRFSDFVVREVALDGRVVTLSDVPRFAPAAKLEKVSEVFKHRVFALLNDAANDKMDIPEPVHTLVGKLAGRLLGLFNANKRARALKQEKEDVLKLRAAIAEVCGKETAQQVEEFMLRLVDAQEQEEAAKRLVNNASKSNSAEKTETTQEATDEQIHAAVRSWSEHGFINYFGLQRFGTKAIATHEIGRAILQRDHKRVVDLMLSPQEGDATKIREARQAFQNDQDVGAALKALPPYLIAERAVLHGLRENGLTSYAAAIQGIPRHLRMMYTHAYQSYVWNTVASDRLTRFSRESPVVGDLVIPHDKMTEDAVDESEDGGVEREAEASSPATKKPKTSAEASRPKANVTVVTAENLAQFSIYDVVLPLPGYSIKYPENALKQRYDEVMRADGVDFQSLERATNSEYHLPGSYRHVVKKPVDVKHDLKRYTDPTVPLLETDVDHLEGRTAQASVPGGKSRALCLEFQLGPSSYATMAVRELLKQSSNLDVQLQLKQRLDTNTSKPAKLEAPESAR